MTARARATAATGERLLATAWRHFATRPYEEVILREIAAEAQVTAQTLHARFGSKEELFIAAYAWFGWQEKMRRAEAPVGRVREAVKVLFDSYEAHGSAVLRMLSQEERIPAVRKMTDAGRAYHRSWAETTFRSLLADLTGDTRERRLTAIVIATDLLVWKLLRNDMKLRREQAEGVMAEMVQWLPCAG
jgi:AcrR family transcriptional regulator